MKKRPVPDCMIPFIDNMRKINFIDDSKSSIVFKGEITFVNVLTDTTSPDLPEDSYFVKIYFGDEDNPTSITSELDSLNPYVEFYKNDEHLGNLMLHYEYYEEDEVQTLTTKWYLNTTQEGSWMKEGAASKVIIHIGSYTKTFGN